MSNYLKILSPRAQLGLYISLLGMAWLLALLISSTILLAKGGFMTGSGHTVINFDDPALGGLFKFLQGLSTVIIFLVPALLYALFTFRTRNLYFLGFRKAEKNSFYI